MPCCACGELLNCVFEAKCRSTASGGLFSSGPTLMKPVTSSPALTGAVTSSAAIIKPAINAPGTSMVSQSSPVTAAGSQSGMASRPLAGLDSLGMRSQAKRSTLTIDQVLLLLCCNSGCLHTCSFASRWLHSCLALPVWIGPGWAVQNTQGLAYILQSVLSLTMSVQPSG